MFLIGFYVPATHAETVKNAMFAAGAGHIGAYSHCAWQTAGTGQFLPAAHASPFTGTPGMPETTPELKIEMVCNDVVLKPVIAALKKNHPYETPAFHVLRMEDC